jgi:hypothetical protein
MYEHVQVISQTDISRPVSGVSLRLPNMAASISEVEPETDGSQESACSKDTARAAKSTGVTGSSWPVSH